MDSLSESIQFRYLPMFTLESPQLPVMQVVTPS